MVNGGAILYTNTGLQYKFKDFSLGVQYGHLDFVTGIQEVIMCLFLSKFQQLSELDLTEMLKKSFRFAIIQTVVFGRHLQQKSVQQVTFDFFYPMGKTRDDGQGNFNRTQPINQTLYIIGFEYQKYISHNAFLYAHLDTMYKGLRAGFMDLFFGVGKNFWETEYINFFAKFGIGAAGGRIFPENGLTMYPSTGFDLKFTEHFGLSFHGVPQIYWSNI